MPKTFEEINEKIAAKRAVVVTAEEMIGVVEEKGAKKAAETVDVVTTGTFGPMCSSGAQINVGHPTPRMKIQKAWLNGVPAQAGLAAVDLYVGASALPEDDPANKVFPGRFAYGGGHVIEDLVRGKDVLLEARAYGTDEYPRTKLETLINLASVNRAILLNPRNAYQNYNVAVNASVSRPLYTYLGVLLPKRSNANYATAGQLSPLLNDPFYRTIGVGTRIFLGGGTGYVFFAGSQHDPTVKRTKQGVPVEGAGTLSVTGDLKGMSADFLRGVSVRGYGASLAVGIGVPIPVLDEEMARFTAVRDEDILAPVVDYGTDYAENTGKVLARVSYAALRSGTIEVDGKKVRTASVSSVPKAREIAEALKRRIEAGDFRLGKPVETLPGPGEGESMRPLVIRPPSTTAGGLSPPRTQRIEGG